jgi:hypothetical protein
MGLITLLLADRSTRTIFETVARERKISHKDLVQTLTRIAGVVSTNEISTRLDQLEEAKLIGEQGAPIEDFKTYYITADGLSAERELRRQQSLFAVR